jgi:hypothetical protein
VFLLKRLSLLCDPPSNFAGVSHGPPHTGMVMGILPPLPKPFASVRRQPRGAVIPALMLPCCHAQDLGLFLGHLDGARLPPVPLPLHWPRRMIEHHSSFEWQRQHPHDPPYRRGSCRPGPQSSPAVVGGRRCLGWAAPYPPRLPFFPASRLRSRS